MQDSASELLRIGLPRTPVHKSKGKDRGLTLRPFSDGSLRTLAPRKPSRKASKGQTLSIASSESHIAKTYLILGDENRGRFRPYGAILGLDCGIPLKETRHRDLYIFQGGLGVVNSDTLQICLVHSHLDSVNAAQEQFGRKVRRNLDVRLCRCPKCRLQPPRE